MEYKIFKDSNLPFIFILDIKIKKLEISINPYKYKSIEFKISKIKIPFRD